MNTSRIPCIFVVALTFGCSSDQRAQLDGGTPPAGDSGVGPIDGAVSADAAVCVDDDAVCTEACSWISDSDCPICGPMGMLTPMQPCSESHPCTSLLASYTEASITDPPLSVIDFPSFVPACATSARGLDKGRPAYDDGDPITWTDMDGTSRYRCEYRPEGISPTSKRPLVLFVHGSGGYAYSVYDTTSLRAKAPSYDLTGDVERPGFVLVAVQGRNIHWPTATAQDGAKHDTFYRDLASPSKNRDIAYYDDIIDSLVAEGVVDPDQIYITGWSNGARFAALYGIARHTTSTPGGNRIAAVANYSGGDPFSNTYTGQEPSCQQTTYPTSEVPFLMVSRTCDAVACDAAQDEGFVAEGTDTSPGNIAEDWIATLRTAIANPNVTWTLITKNAIAVSEGACTPSSLCKTVGGLINHIRWPDGIDDSSGNDHEPDMLDFMRANPLN